MPSSLSRIALGQMERLLKGMQRRADAQEASCGAEAQAGGQGVPVATANFAVQLETMRLQVQTS
jgi:hypothetical protein